MIFHSPIQIHQNQKEFKPRNIAKKASYASPSDRKKKLSPQVEENVLLALNAAISKYKESTLLPDSTRSLVSSIASIEEPSQSKDTTLLTAFYEKILDTLIHVDTNGIRETTLILADNTPLRGTKITITEFSTAPKVFNIQCAASAQMLEFFQRHAPGLILALQKSPTSFAVHRVDTTLLVEEKRFPKVERKEETNNE